MAEESIKESIDEDSIDSFDEYLESKFGTSIVKSGAQQKSQPNVGKFRPKMFLNMFNILIIVRIYE
jgi:hypothetical protein